MYIHILYTYTYTCCTYILDTHICILPVSKSAISPEPNDAIK